LHGGWLSFGDVPWIRSASNDRAVMRPLRAWLRQRFVSRRTSHHDVDGLPLVVINTRADVDTDEVVSRIRQAVALIGEYTPHYARHLKRDFAGFVSQRYACRGAYDPARRLCLVELTFAVNPQFSIAQIAASILHEAMHARLHALGFPLEMEDRARQERFCRRAEVEFGSLAPDGAPVVARALAALRSADEDVAPVVDPALAARRVAEADMAALPAREWVKRALQRVRDARS
jgi:hypothetical protein